MKLGVAKRCITPRIPVRLCGYAGRTGSFEGVMEDIYVRVHWQETGATRLVLIYGDLLWWGSDFVETAQKELLSKLGLKTGEVLFIASHNHSGPPTSDLFTDELETYSPKYAGQLLEAVIQAAREASQNSEEVILKRYDGEAFLNVYRRVRCGERIEMRPNYEEPADHHIVVIEFERPDGTVKGRWVHYPCHANLSSGNQIHGDYPGVLLRKLDDKTPGCISVFFQGCTGDLRPNCVLGNRFVPADWDKIQNFAEQLEEIIGEMLKGRGERIDGELILRHREVPLSLENCRTDESLREIAETSLSNLEREWANAVLKKGNKNNETFKIQSVQYGTLQVFFFNAEISQFYAAYARKLFPGALSAGYANGMIGYVMTAHQIKEGGYEPWESAKYFALSGTYVPEIEETIKNAIQNINN